MLKCPIHELPRNIVINNFYARLSEHYKDYLDAYFEGSFTSKEVDTKWDLLETIQSNIEDWDCDKCKGSGINYEYDCIKSFAKTVDFQELSAKYGLDPQIMVDCYRAFDSHINVPKGNWDMYHETFKDTCMESEIIIDDCNTSGKRLLVAHHFSLCVAHMGCATNATPLVTVYQWHISICATHSLKVSGTYSICAISILCVAHIAICATNT
jgi:hypothetical protein